MMEFSGLILKDLLGGHVGGDRGVSEGLCLHDALHVCTPPILPSDQHTGGVHYSVRHQALQEKDKCQKIQHQLSDESFSFVQAYSKFAPIPQNCRRLL